MPADTFDDPNVRMRCQLVLAYARRYGAIRHYQYSRGNHVMFEGKRAPLSIELAVSVLKERGLLMRDGTSAMVLTKAGKDLLDLWNEQVFGVPEPVTNEAAARAELPCDSDA